VLTIVAVLAIWVGGEMLASRQTRAEVYDMIQFHWSRWRTRRLVPRAELVFRDKPAARIG